MPWEKQFDVEAAVDRAVDVFWEQGYERASLPDLLKAMGINRGSFYDTYGSKHALLNAALERYMTHRFEQFKALAESASPKQAILGIFSAASSESTGDSAQRGCMAVNCALELGPHDPEVAERLRQAMGEQVGMLAEWVVAGQKDGEIGSDRPADEIAQGLLALLIGLRVMARVGMPRAFLGAITRQANELLE